MKNYKFGFSIRGFLAFVLVMIPNIIWMVKPPVNDVLAKNSSIYPALDMTGHISQAIMLAILFLIINKDKTTNGKVKSCISLAILCLIGYYISWGFYYLGMVDSWLLIVMAFLPSVFFIFVEIWLKNYIAIIPSIVFVIAHIAITCSNYL